MRNYRREGLSQESLEGLASGRLLPRLSKLACVVHNVNKIRAHLDMIEYRSRAQPTVASIMKVRFFKYGVWDMEAPLVPRVNKLREGGLIVQFAA